MCARDGRVGGWWMLSHVCLFVIPLTVAHQAPLSVEFSRQEYLSGSPFLPPGDLPNPGIEPKSPSVRAGYLPSQPLGKPIPTLGQDKRSKLVIQSCPSSGINENDRKTGTSP